VRGRRSEMMVKKRNMAWLGLAVREKRDAKRLRKKCCVRMMKSHKVFSNGENNHGIMLNINAIARDKTAKV